MIYCNYVIIWYWSLTADIFRVALLVFCNKQYICDSSQVSIQKQHNFQIYFQKEGKRKS